MIKNIYLIQKKVVCIMSTAIFYFVWFLFLLIWLILFLSWLLFILLKLFYLWNSLPFLGVNEVDAQSVFERGTSESHEHERGNVTSNLCILLLLSYLIFINNNFLLTLYCLLLNSSTISLPIIQMFKLNIFLIDCPATSFWELAKLWHKQSKFKI